ncbi:MAG TPA: FHA domain-containing protein, partial [Protaetiibacter sp.]|nr:FHA domain-containing protein [Protaetiibacter sp.]
MTHRYTAASDGWLAFITPARQLFVAGNPDAAIIDRLWTRIRDERGPAGVLETLAANGLFSTPPFAFIELGDGGVDVIVRGDAVVRTGAEQVSGSGAATWIERRLPGGSVGVTLAGSGSLELPIEAGVVRAAAFATGTALPRQAAVPTTDPRPVATPADAQAATPEPAFVDVPPDATIPLAQFIAEEEARARAAEAEGPTGVSEETVVELPDAAAPPATPTTAEPPAADAGAASGDGYDYLFGETVYHSVQDAAVRTEAPADDETPAEQQAAEQPAEGDHDGSTVLASSITRTGRQRRPRGKAAAPAAPAIAVVLPTGAREPLEEALVLGRSPSVSGVPGGQLPRLVTLSSGDQDISRSHVRIALEGGTVVVTDLHSRNGTTIV